ELLTLRGHMDRVNSVAFSPDGRRIVTGSSDCTAKIWDAASGQEPFEFKGPYHNLCVALSPDGQRIVIGDNNTAKIVEAVSGRELATFKGHTGAIFFVAFSPDGQRVVTISEDRTAKIWLAATGEQLLTLE